MSPARWSEKDEQDFRGARQGSDDYSDEHMDTASEDDEKLDGGIDGKGSEEDESTEAEENVEQRIQNVSFGALKQAQDALSRKRKRGSDTTADQDEKLEALRARLHQIRSKSAKDSKNGRSKGGRSQHSGHHDSSDLALSDGRLHQRLEVEHDSDEDSDSAPSEEGKQAKSRTSKHAPTSQSSKHQVTRKRNVVDVPKRNYRDPRFDALQQHTSQATNTAKAYSFLQDYQKDEIAELKSAIKQTRNEEDKETLRRKLVSMENKIKSQEAKDREQEIRRRHRKEEREMVEQGKKPFYLKKKDVKERAMVEKFKGMKSKEREKLMERRRRKEDQKEKRKIPEARRTT